MKNYVHCGDMIPCVAPYNVLSGAGFLVGLLFAVATTDALAGTYVEGKTRGVFDLPALVTDVASGTALVAAYWDDANKRVTVSSAGNTKIGVIVKAKANGDTVARVRLNGTA